MSPAGYTSRQGVLLAAQRRRGGVLQLREESQVSEFYSLHPVIRLIANMLQAESSRGDVGKCTIVRKHFNNIISKKNAGHFWKQERLLNYFYVIIFCQFASLEWAKKERWNCVIYAY